MTLSEQAISEIHPIAIGLIFFVSEDVQSASEVEISEALLFELRFELAQLFGSEELRWAVGSLIDFVNVLEHEGNTDAARTLMTGIETPELVEAMRVLNERRSGEAQDQVLEGREKFRKLSDDKRFAEIPPELVKTKKVSVDALAFPRRI